MAEEHVDINEVVCKFLGIDLKDTYLRSVQLNLHANDVPTVTTVKYIDTELAKNVLAEYEGKLRLVED